MSTENGKNHIQIRRIKRNVRRTEDDKRKGYRQARQQWSATTLKAGHEPHYQYLTMGELNQENKQ